MVIEKPKPRPPAKRRAVPDRDRCVACGACEAVCPRGAIKVWKGSYSVVDASRCVGCGLCARECPASVIAIEVIA
ncbi:MAG: 4Fe-4S binding protein [Schwartzia sp.]|nr:4Fe-4S binding protein [Schwartzia sp. (in: firmicutes)]